METQAEYQAEPQEAPSLQVMIAVTSVPAKLEVNFEALATALRKEVARYKGVVVTMDTVTGARKLAAELNAVAGVIDAKRKEEVAKASEPLRQFDQRMRDLAQIALVEREKIQKQIEACDDKTREQATLLLSEARGDFWKEMEVANEFRRAEFADLVMVSAVTKAGALAGKQKTILQNRCREDKMMQDRTERRLLELENASLRAGLSAPLTRDHVEHFLFSDNERYSRELERILTAEVQRQEQAERAMRERLEREARQKAEAEQREKERRERAARQQAEAEACERQRRAEAEQREKAQYQQQSVTTLLSGKPQADRQARQFIDSLPRDTQWESEPHEELTPEDEQKMLAAKLDAAREFGKRAGEMMPDEFRSRRVRVVAQFEIDAPAGVSDADLVAECRRVMEAAGITTLTEVYVVHGDGAGRRAREDAA